MVEVSFVEVVLLSGTLAVVATVACGTLGAVALLVFSGEVYAEWRSSRN